MLFGVIADDFTGATDVANAVARRGLSARLHIGEAARPSSDVDVAVIALKSRSIVPDLAVKQSLEAMDRLRAAGCQQILFKYCSTFDSTPQGNIGPVAEALAKALDAKAVVVCPAFPQTGRTVFQGHLFVGDRLLSESGLQNHPLNPMTDPDLRRWLARQTGETIAHLPLWVVRQGAHAISAELSDCASRFVVVDATSDEDLIALGEAIGQARLITGASGVALGLADHHRHRGGGGPSRFMANQDPAVVLSGSCSQATRQQIQTYRDRAPALELDVEALMAGADEVGRAQAFLEKTIGSDPLIFSTADPASVFALQMRFEKVSTRIEAFFAQMALVGVGLGARRIVTAGGETSGAVVEALQVTDLEIGPEIAPGVPAVSDAGKDLALALKSGNFGGPDFFSRALGVLAGADV